MALNFKQILKSLKIRYIKTINTLSVKRLLGQIESADISSGTIYVFSAKGSRFYTDIFILLAYELSKQGARSCFLFKNA